MTDDSAKLPVGTLLFNGKYRIEQFLAAGGFGNTYRGRDLQFDEQVAVKELFLKEACGRTSDTLLVSVSLTANQKSFESFREKLRKEARRLRKLHNQHIVAVRDLFDENGTTYYAMDYIEGQSLARRLKVDRNPLPEREVMTVILPQLLDALATVHAAGIWHLDLKPDNIMQTPSGNIVLIDFGASKQPHVEDGAPKLSSTTNYLTKGYAPSEQMAGKMEKYGPWTDFYALGATLFNLLTNECPPDRTDLADNPHYLQDALRAMSPATVNLIVWMMNDGTKQRPQNVKEIRAFLKKKMNGTFGQSNGDVGTVIRDSEPISSDVEHKRLMKWWTKLSTSTKGGCWTVFRKILGWVAGLMLVAGAFVGWLWWKDKVASEQEQSSKAVVRDTTKLIPRENKMTVANLSDYMVKVDGGTFMMGARADDSEAYDDEKPAHQVTLSSYYICKYEVTQALWVAVMGSDPSYFEGDNLPVETVSWNDCQQFISKLNALTGLHYRLPTEAEWEFAARGGNSSRGYKYSGGSTLSDVSWYGDNSGRTTHPVGTKSPNELGLYDMSGNVWEWCSDWYGDYSSSAQTNPAGPSSGLYHVNRGGSWYCNARSCRASDRLVNAPDYRDGGLGLRLVRS